MPIDQLLGYIVERHFSDADQRRRLHRAISVLQAVRKRFRSVFREKGRQSAPATVTIQKVALLGLSTIAVPRATRSDLRAFLDPAVAGRSEVGRPRTPQSGLELAVRLAVVALSGAAPQNGP